MNKKEYIEAIAELLEKNDDDVMIEFIFYLLNKAFQ